MRVFIVHAHHEPQSFNGAMTREAMAALAGAGHEVIVSDLHAVAFNPVSDRRNFTTVANSERLRQQAEEAYAAQHDGFAADIKAEMDKLFWCDVLILQFPLWWFGLPAILKGWVDRVFAAGGKIYGGGAPMYSRHGLNGPIESILFPVNHGILYFTGFSVIEPFIVHAPARISDAERAEELAHYRARVLALDSAPTIAYAKLADYDERYVLKSPPSHPGSGC